MPAKSLFTFIAWLLVLGCSEAAKIDDEPGANGGSAGVSSPVGGSAGGPAVGGESGAGESGAGESGAGGAAASGAGTGAGGGEPSEDALIVPEGLSVASLPGGCGELSMIALTVRQGPTGGELYAALRNDGDTPACSPSFSVELFDKSDQPVAAGITGLLLRRFYHLADDSETIAACVAPGDIAMGAIRDLPSDMVIDDLGRVSYWCNFWVLDLVPLGEISIDEVRAVTRSSGVAYTGALVNGLDVPVSSPSVAIFPVNRAGRPLGVVFGQGTVEVPPGGTWEFETDTSSVSGVDQAAYPASGP